MSVLSPLPVQELNVLACFKSLQNDLKMIKHNRHEFVGLYSPNDFGFSSFRIKKSCIKNYQWVALSQLCYCLFFFLFCLCVLRLGVIYDSMASSSSINLEGTFRAELFLNAWKWGSRKWKSNHSLTCSHANSQLWNQMSFPSS